jgi:hypothetical protein
MNKSFASPRYDLFKLIVALMLLIIVLLTLPSSPSTVLENGNAGIATDPAPVSAADEVSPPSPSEPPETAGLPALPQTVVELTLDESKRNLLAPDGRIVYNLDEEHGGWLPVVPQEIQNRLREGDFLRETEGMGWIIQSDQGRPLYTWNQDTLTWSEGQVSPPVSGGDCPVLQQARLQADGKARVLTNLNMRSTPGIEDNWLVTNVTGTELKIISGPVCTVQTQGAYWWWEVENPYGQRGWSAEAHESGYYYFLEPLAP